MRIASFNVENLFERAKALNLDTWAQGRQALERHAQINQLLNKASYSAADKARIVELLTALGLDKSDDGHEFARLRQNRGKLLKRPRSGPLQIVANGRDDWIGWVELKTEHVDELASRHTGDGDPAGRRRRARRGGGGGPRRAQAVLRFPAGGGRRHAVCARDGHRRQRRPQQRRRPHDQDRLRRRCGPLARRRRRPGPGLQPRLPRVPRHRAVGRAARRARQPPQEQGFGTTADSNARRKRQAQRVAEIYQRLRADGERHVAVLGDLNDTPDSAPLAPLLANTDLKDITLHPSFVGDGRPGTFGNGTKSNKIDYVLLSPELFANVTGGEIFRMGVWGGVHGTLFPHFPTMTKAVHAASDHAAIFADVDL
jgi:hypothetical protein